MNTPRTDAERRRLKKSKSYPPDPVSAEFARQLETELAAMTDLADRMAEALGTCAFKDWFKSQQTGQISVVLDAVKVREALAAYEAHKKGNTL